MPALRHSPPECHVRDSSFPSTALSSCRPLLPRMPIAVVRSGLSAGRGGDWHARQQRAARAARNCFDAMSRTSELLRRREPDLPPTLPILQTLARPDVLGTSTYRSCRPRRRADEAATEEHNMEPTQIYKHSGGLGSAPPRGAARPARRAAGSPPARRFASGRGLPRPAHGRHHSPERRRAHGTAREGAGRVRDPPPRRRPPTRYRPP